MRTTLSFALLALTLLVGPLRSVLAGVDVQIVGNYAAAHAGGDYGGDGNGGDNDGDNDGGYGGDNDGGYGGDNDGGYGGGYGGHGHGKWGDVEMFLKMRRLLIEAATNAIGFSQLGALNAFNEEVLNFPYSFPGTLSLFVRELEKVPPYYKYGYLHKKQSRSVDNVDDEHDMK